MTIRVLIADDHKVVRQGLRLFLRVDSDIEIVGEAANGAEAVELARQLFPDVVLMDILMPMMDGIAATTAIRKECSEVEVLGLTSVLEDTAIVEIMRGSCWRSRRKPRSKNGSAWLANCTIRSPRPCTALLWGHRRPALLWSPIAYMPWSPSIVYSRWRRRRTLKCVR